jgi:signal transduction histidine kinase
MSSSARSAHDLKNQLGIILGFVELLIADAGERGEREDLVEIQKAAQRALALVPDACGAVADESSEPATEVESSDQRGALRADAAWRRRSRAS